MYGILICLILVKASLHDIHTRTVIHPTSVLIRSISVVSNFPNHTAAHAVIHEASGAYESIDVG